MVCVGGSVLMSATILSPHYTNEALMMRSKWNKNGEEEEQACGISHMPVKEAALLRCVIQLRRYSSGLDDQLVE